MKDKKIINKFKAETYTLWAEYTDAKNVTYLTSCEMLPFEVNARLTDPNLKQIVKIEPSSFGKEYLVVKVEDIIQLYNKQNTLNKEPWKVIPPTMTAVVDMRHRPSSIEHKGRKWDVVRTEMNFAAPNKSQGVVAVQNVECEKLFLDFNSPEIESRYQTTLNKAKTVLDAGKSVGDILTVVANEVDSTTTNNQNLFHGWPRDLIEKQLDERVQWYLGKYHAGVSDPYLTMDECIDKGIMICRHKALLSAHFIGRLIQDGVLPQGSSARQYRSFIHFGAHAWSVFRDGQTGDLWVIDPRWLKVEKIDEHNTVDLGYGIEAMKLMIDRLQHCDKDILDRIKSNANRQPQPDTNMLAAQPKMVNMFSRASANSVPYGLVNTQPQQQCSAYMPKLIDGNILDSNKDTTIFINPANPVYVSKRGDTGVSGAIIKYYQDKIGADSLNTYLKTVKDIPTDINGFRCLPGVAMHTCVENINIIHVSSPNLRIERQSQETEAKLYSSYYQAFLKADELIRQNNQLSTLNVPLLGTLNHKWELIDSASIALNALKSFKSDREDSKLVVNFFALNIPEDVKDKINQNIVQLFPAKPKLIVGDMFKDKKDNTIFVNAADPKHVARPTDKGVSGAIINLYKGIGENDLNNYLKSVAAFPENAKGLRCPSGVVLHTDVSDYNILHCSAPDLRVSADNTAISESKLFSSYYELFIAADNLNIQHNQLSTLNCPLLGSGIYRWDPKVSAQIAVNALKQFQSERPNSKVMVNLFALGISQEMQAQINEVIEKSYAPSIKTKHRH